MSQSFKNNLLSLDSNKKETRKEKWVDHKYHNFIIFIELIKILIKLLLMLKLLPLDYRFSMEEHIKITNYMLIKSRKVVLWK